MATTVIENPENKENIHINILLNLKDNNNNNVAKHIKVNLKQQHQQQPTNNMKPPQNECANIKNAFKPKPNVKKHHHQHRHSHQKPNQRFSLPHSDTSTSPNDDNNKFINSKRFETISELYSTSSNNNLISIYGSSSFSYSKHLDDTTNKISETFLSPHKMNPLHHRRMIDWMIEVLSVYNSSPDTFFLSVHVMNLYISKTKKLLKDSDVYLLGITSMFIAHKYEEIYAFSLNDVVKKISHNSFTANQIRQSEKDVVKTISLDCLIYSSVFEFVKVFLFDLVFNNGKSLKQERLEMFYDMISNTTLYLSMLVMHYNEFYSYSNCAKAVGCIFAGKRLVFENSKMEFNDSQKEFVDEWLDFLLEQIEYSQKKIEELADNIIKAYYNYQNASGLNKNLDVFYPLPWKKKNKKK